MKKLLILFFISSLLISCSTTKKLTNETARENISNSSGNDGTSYEKAIIINEKSEQKGIDAEYAWLRQNYPGSRLVRQALNFNKEKPYDILTILSAEGVEKKIYFDISKFYGKQ